MHVCTQFPNLTSYAWGMYPTTLTPNSFSNSRRDMSVATITCRGGRRGGGRGGGGEGGGEGGARGEKRGGEKGEEGRGLRRGEKRGGDRERG